MGHTDPRDIIAYAGENLSEASAADAESLNMIDYKAGKRLKETRYNYRCIPEIAVQCI